MKKKVVLLLFLFLCTLGIKVKASQQSLNITSKNTINNTKKVDINIKSPEIQSKDKIVNNIFNKINNDIKSWSGNLINEANSDQFGSKYEVNSSFYVPYNANGLLSLNIMNYYYAGGAHGLSNLKSYNYDIKTGNELKLKEFFIDGYDYKSFINAKIRKYIAADKDSYFSEGAYFKGISDNQEFYISNDGITVYFQVYEIAPYASGIRSFLIPKAEILNNLKIKF